MPSDTSDADSTPNPTTPDTSTDTSADSGAQLVSDHIEVDTDAWLARVTGGRLDELTDVFNQFDQDVLGFTRDDRVDTVQLFITARVGHGWQDRPHAVIQTAGAGAHARLRRSVIIHRYEDPTFGAVAFVAGALWHYTGSLISDNPWPVAYADTALADPEGWLTFDHVEISCAGGCHRWRVHGPELIDGDGARRDVADVFPGGVVTTDTDPGSDTYGDSRITCPTCGSECHVRLLDERSPARPGGGQQHEHPQHEHSRQEHPQQTSEEGRG